MAFVDFEKAFDRVNRCKLWQILEERGYPQQLIRMIQCFYSQTKINVKNNGKTSVKIVTNQGVRQGCTLSPTLFNIYIDDLVRKWKQLVNVGFQISKNNFLNILLFADDLVVIQNSESALQKSIFKLNEIGEQYNMKISLIKTKVMAFIGKEPIRTKIAINNCCIEQVSHFNYLGSDVGFDKEYDVDNKICNFQRVCGTINRTFRNKIRKETKLKFYKVMAVPTLAYGSETWTLTKKQQSKIQTTEMKFLRNVKGCTKRDLITNENIREELEIFNINERLKDFKQNWKEHVDRMPDTRLTKQIMQYHPKGRRSVGRPRKRWLEDFEDGTGI